MRPLGLLAALGLVFVFVRALLRLGAPDGLAPFIAVASFVAYLLAAEAVLSRARPARGPTTDVAVGVAQWAPAFAWVPYLVIALHVGPELAVADAVRGTGIAFTVLGVAVALWALFTIGRHFDLELAVHSDHEVVRTGPYAIVRHPIYAGLAIHTVGAALATGNVLYAAGSLAITFPLLYARARAEERLLRVQLGAAYDAYARDVGMLVPFVGRT